MTSRVNIKPELLRWAHKRGRADMDALVRKFPKYREWEGGEVRPTFKQFEKSTKTVHVGGGHFFSPEPLDEPSSIPDLRTVGRIPDACNSFGIECLTPFEMQRQEGACFALGAAA